MRLDSLHNLIAHAINRIQACHGLLEDHGDVATAHLLHLGLGQRQQVLAVKGDGASGYVAGFLQQTHDGERRDALARAGLAHHGQDLALFKIECDAVDRAHHALAGGKFGHQVMNL